MADAQKDAGLEAELLAFAAGYRHFVDGVPAALFRYVLRPDGANAVVDMSPRCVDLWEIPAERIHQDSALLWAMVDPRDLAAMQGSIMQSAQTLAPWQWEWRITTPSGRRKWLQGLGRPRRQDDGGTVWDSLIFDITARKQAEEALQLSELRLRQVMAVTGSGLWEWQVERDLVSHDPRWCGLLGLGQSHLQHAMAEFMPLIYAADRAGVMARLQACLAGQGPYASEHRMVRADGSLLWVEDRGDVVERDADGAPLRMLGSITDITSRRQAETALQENEQRLQALLDNLGCGVVVHGPDSQVIDANPAASRLIGLSLDHMRGKVSIDPAWCFLEEDGTLMPLARFPVSQVLGSGNAVSKLVLGIERPDLTKPVWVQVDAYPLRDAQAAITQVVVTFVDITPLKVAQDGMRRLNRALRVLSSGTVSLADVQDESVYLNRLCEMVAEAGGFLSAAVIFANHDATKSARVAACAGSAADYLTSLQLSWDDSVPIGRGPFGVAVRTATTQVNQDWRTNQVMAPWRDRALAHGFRLSIALPLTVANEVVGVLSLYASELDAFNPEELPPLEELARNISVAIDTLRTRHQRDRAEGANRAKSVFLANMSHEIRTPLNAIVGLNYLLRRDGVTPAQAARVDKIDRASHHLLALINDILDFSKVEAGQVQLESTDFHLSTVLDAVVSLIADAAQVKGLHIVVDTDGVPVWLLGDPTRLQQALLNFAGNAVKFTPGGTLTLRSELLADDGDGLLLRFSVADTGIGIAAEHIPRLFQSFEQADASITRKFGGTGLGLAITKRLAALMGGDCGVDSTVGQGSTFWFTARLQRGQGSLPLAGPTSAATAEQGLRLRHAGARILIAEDNPVNQEVLSAMLSALGFDVDMAANGEEAVIKAMGAHYSLVLMDMQMPVMGGLEATRIIRTLPTWARRPILALTANAFEEDRRACKAAGMDDFIVKPVDVNTLYVAMLHWLDLAGQS